MSGAESFNGAMTKVKTYFIYCPELKTVKIGRTAVSPERRFRDMQTAFSTPHHLVGHIDGDVESSLHERFASLRIFGDTVGSEWFKCEGELSRYLKTQFQFDALDYSRQRSHAIADYVPPKIDTRAMALYAAQDLNGHVVWLNAQVGCEGLEDPYSELESLVHETVSGWCAKGCREARRLERIHEYLFKRRDLDDPIGVFHEFSRRISSDFEIPLAASLTVEDLPQDVYAIILSKIDDGVPELELTMMFHCRNRPQWLRVLNSHWSNCGDDDYLWIQPFLGWYGKDGHICQERCPI